MKLKIIETINETEASALQRCEAVIQQGLGTFLEVGAALLTIREQRLYRESYSAFEQYCRKRWRMGSRHACRLADAAVVVRNLCPIGHSPASESQIRPLTSLPVEKQREVWAEAVKIDPNPTARQVRAVVQKIAPEFLRLPEVGPTQSVETREERCCAICERFGPEIQRLQEQFNDLPRMHDLLGQCAHALWLCNEEALERMQLVG